MHDPLCANRVHTNRARLLRIAGLVVALCGALAVVTGGVLPWAQVRFFGMSVAVPGVAGWGMVTTGMGLAALVSIRAYPLTVAGLGAICIVSGLVAQREVGRQIARQVLRVQQALAPINARLEQVSLPPIEPFSGVHPARTYVGPGPLWTCWGGTFLLAGGALRFVGGRMARSCARCGAVWPGDTPPNFCSRCGGLAAIARLCARCCHPVAEADRFCSFCGERNS